MRTPPAWLRQWRPEATAPGSCCANWPSRWCATCSNSRPRGFASFAERFAARDVLRGREVAAQRRHRRPVRRRGLGRRAAGAHRRRPAADFQRRSERAASRPDPLTRMNRCALLVIVLLVLANAGYFWWSARRSCRLRPGSGRAQRARAAAHVAPGATPSCCRSARKRSRARLLPESPDQSRCRFTLEAHREQRARRLLAGMRISPGFTLRAVLAWRSPARSPGPGPSRRPWCPARGRRAGTPVRGPTSRMPGPLSSTSSTSTPPKGSVIRRTVTRPGRSVVEGV